MRRIAVVLAAIILALGGCLAQQQPFELAEGENLLENGHLATDADGDGVPDGWAWAEGKFGKLGEVEWTTEGALEGDVSVHYVKTDPQKWYPQVWYEGADIKPGWQYQLSAIVHSDARFVFRHTLNGEMGGKQHRPMPAQPEPTRVGFTFDSPLGTDHVRIGFQMSGNAGEMRIDDVRLIALGPSLEAMMLPEAPDDIHNLEELATRRIFKPFELIAGEDGVYPSERVIFRDSSTGAITAKMTHNPYYNRHIYSNQWIWNWDGSLLSLRTRRVPDGWYLMGADGGNIRYMTNQMPFWHRGDPDVMFYRDTSEMSIKRHNVRTGEVETVWTVPEDLGGLGYSIWPMHPDGQKFFVTVGNQTKRVDGNWGYMMNVDGTDVVRIDFPHTTHQVWFTKAPEYTISYNYERRAPGDYIDASFLVDGDGTNHRKVRDRHMSHRGYSPSGERVAFHGGGGVRVMGIEGDNERLLAPGPGGHLSWQVDDEWLVATQRNAIQRIWTDNGHKTMINAPNTQLYYYNYPCEAHLESSPDGTKIGYASCMLGDIDLYQVVMKLPDPPQFVRADADGDRIRLEWEPPVHSQEVAGYNVYASDVSGEDYALVNAEPIEDTSFECGPAEGLFFVVTAVEHSDLEGRPSAEVAIAGGDMPRRIWLEAEDARLQAPFEPIFDMDCSAMYATASTEHGKTASATVSTDVPASGRYALWARVKSIGDATVTVTADGEQVGEMALGESEWHWQQVMAGEAACSLALDEGEAELALITENGGVMVDQLLLTGDGDYLPEGAPTWLRTLPVRMPRVEELQAEVLSPYVVRLDWENVYAPNFSHCNVYAASGEEPAGQEHLIASPRESMRFDWGLQAGTPYTWAVTVVDRQGNEGPPVTVSATTPEIERVFIETEIEAALKDAPLTADFTLPRDDTYLAWVRIYSRDEKRGNVGVFLDGEKIMGGADIPWEFVTRGHGGPIKDTEFWVPLQMKTERPRPLREIAAGEHTLRVEAEKTIDAVIDRVVVTNDLGWRPKGISSFLPVGEGEG